MRIKFSAEGAASPCRRLWEGEDGEGRRVVGWGGFWWLMTDVCLRARLACFELASIFGRHMDGSWQVQLARLGGHLRNAGWLA